MNLLCLCAVSQVMLNSPKRIEEEKVKMAEKEKAREKENKTPAKTNSANGTGGTPIHVSTLQVSVCIPLKGTYYAKIPFIRCLNTVVWPQCVKTTSL